MADAAERADLCPLCDGKTTEVGRLGRRDAYAVYCDTCGNYTITLEALGAVASPALKSKRYIISAATRNATDADQHLELTTAILQDIISGARLPVSLLDALDEILLSIHKHTTSLTGYLNFPYTAYPEYTLRGREELRDLLLQLRALGFLDGDDDGTGAGFLGRLTVGGWKHALKLRSDRPLTKQAFVAMWFDPSLEAAWLEGFVPALVNTGWSPVRMDRLEHNDRIDDRIIGEIKRSGLLVADFTGNRGGVYFEAGLALGLGLPVIWTVREDAFAGVHFDTRQYNHIAWQTPTQLREGLTNRIAATIPRPVA